MDTIKNISLLSQMQSIAALLLSRIEALENEGGVVHAIDADLLRDKTRMLYDLILRLQEKDSTGFDEPKVSNEIISVSNNVFEISTPEIPHHQIVTEEATFVTNETATFQVEADETEVVEDIKTESYTEVSKAPVIDQKFEAPAAHLVQPENMFVSSAKKDAHSTMYDLFGENNTLADAFNANDNSIAAKIEKAAIKDLREAIGINDKFLMINELFEGNISYYNRAIDELNGFQSLNGAKTYLIELSVQHQWNAESAAVAKITQLIERKFNNGF